jgi:hypothetical protein
MKKEILWFQIDFLLSLTPSGKNKSSEVGLCEEFLWFWW